jgi:hypothetical protein
MKKLILLMLLSISFSTIVFSQAESINSSVYWSNYSTATKLMKERTNRSESKVEKFVNSTSTIVTTEKNETLLPDKHRYVRVDFKDGKEDRRLEVIRIEFMQYTRINAEVWKAEDLRNRGGSGSGNGSGSSCIQYSQDSSILDGQTVSVFQSFVVGYGKRGLLFYDTRFWTDSDGVIRKELRSSGLLEPRTEEYRTTINFDYNPKDLKIEAPKMP